MALVQHPLISFDWSSETDDEQDYVPTDRDALWTHVASRLHVLAKREARRAFGGSAGSWTDAAFIVNTHHTQ